MCVTLRLARHRRLVFLARQFLLRAAPLRHRGKGAQHARHAPSREISGDPESVQMA